MLSRLADLPLISGATQKANSDYKGRWLGVYSPDVPSNRRSPLVQPSYSPVLELSSHSRCANLSRRILRGRRMLPQKRHERGMVVGVNDTSVSPTRVLIPFVRQDRHNVGVGTVVVKILRQCASPRVVELMAEQQNSAPAHADLEQGGYHCLHAYNVVTNRCERPCPGLRQGRIG
jgi:hypothetical protein